MALETHDVKKLIELRAARPSGNACLILGDCAFHFSRAYLSTLCGSARVAASPDPATLADVAAALAFERIETVDLFGHPTIHFDLQRDGVPAALRHQFDWVIDAGTLHCCFNVSRVLQNVLEFLRPSGTVFHLGSLTGHLGRGYYSLSPMLFGDFYSQNGFKILEMGVRIKPKEATRPKWYEQGLAGRVTRLLGWPAPREYGWTRIDQNARFVTQSGSREMRLSAVQNADEPDILPNNSLIMCVAARTEPVPFADAVPAFYAR